MATIWNEHGGEPVNEGERIAVDHLRRKLPDDHVIVPSIQIPHQNGSDEIDAIVIGPNFVTAVEVKHYTGQVIFKKQEHRVNGELRSNPVPSIGMKARRLAGALGSADPSLRMVWVTSQVVVVGEPQALHIDSEIQDKVCRLHFAPGRLIDSSVMVPRHIKLGPVRVDKVLQALGVKGKTKRRSEVFGGYRTKELLSEEENQRYYLAESELGGQEVHLRVHVIGAFLPKEERQRLQEKALKGYQALTLLQKAAGWPPQIIGPNHAVKTDHGDIVTISAIGPGTALGDLVETEVTLDQDVRLAIMRDIAKAVQAAHSAGVAHRLLDPSVVLVDPTVSDLNSVVARVVSWDRSTISGSAGGTVHTVLFSGGGSFVAPEALAEKVNDWLTVDLFALGKLARFIWLKLGDPDAQEELPSSLRDALETLCQPDPVERADASAFDLVQVIEELLSPEEPGVVSTDNGLLDGKYEVQKVLGEGTTGQVLAVWDALAGQNFALKKFRPEIDHALIRQEFGILLQLAHKNIVRTHDLFSDGGEIYLKMELLTGRSLQERLTDDGPLEFEPAVNWFLEVLEALQVLHSTRKEGVHFVHRDIKPENLVVEETGRGLVLVDFGLASSGPVEVAGGTARYRSVLYLVDEAVPAMDLFSLAVTFHEAVTGLHPFGEAEICRGTPTVSDDLPFRVCAWFEKALSGSVGDHFTSASEMRSQLLMASQREEELVIEPDPVVEVAEEPEESQIVEGDILGTKVRLAVSSDVEKRQLATTLKGEMDVEAKVSKATITAGPEITLDVELYAAANGESWIQAVDAYGSPRMIQRLVQGLRMGIHEVSTESGVSFMELRQARITDNPDWPKAFMTSVPELNEGAGADGVVLLKEAGALKVATRKEAYGETNNRKNHLCATFTKGDTRVPFVAYALLRVAPLVGTLADAETLAPDGTEDTAAVTPEPVVVAQTSELVLPTLDTKMAVGNGGMGDSYLDGFGYWACHTEKPFRAPGSPFGSLRTALFGSAGAVRLFGSKGKLAKIVQRHGPVLLVVVRLGDVALLTDGKEVAKVAWTDLQVGHVENMEKLFRISDRLPLAEKSFG